MVVRASFNPLWWLTALLLLVPLIMSSGCATTGSTVTMEPNFNPAPEQGIVYIAPFTSTLVPANFHDTLFNTFVDNLNGNKEGTGVRWFYIMKEEMKDLDRAWLGKQVYATGEIWGYVEEPGCCSASLRVKGRIRIFTSGKQEPVAEIFVPLESYFDYNHSTMEAEREKLALRLADELAAHTLVVLGKRP